MSDTQSDTSPLTPSPCIGLCVLDRETQLCMGCLRTGGEIAAWAWAEEPERLDIVQRLRERSEAPEIVEAIERWERENR